MPTVTATTVAVTVTPSAAAFDVAIGDGPPLAVTARLGVGAVDRERDATTVEVTLTLAAGALERLVGGRPVAATATVGGARIDNLTATPVVVRVGIVAPRVVIDRATALTAVAAPATTRPRRQVRFLAQRVLDRRWLSWDLPIRAPRIGWRLNGPTEIAGNVDARDLADAGIDEWATFVHAERDGVIAASAILMPLSPGGVAVDITAAGVTRWPHGQTYQGDFALGSPVGIGIDPLDVVRHIWTHLQAPADGRLGVVVAPTRSEVKIGTPDLSGIPGVSSAGTGPYLLKWWEDTDPGREIDELARETPFDFREAPRWNADRTDVVQHLELGYPRLGRDQRTLAFTEDQNLTEALTPVEDDDRYCSEVVVLGAGEGRTRIRGRYGLPVGRRVRRSVVLQDKTITTVARADSKARDEWSRRRGALTFEKVTLAARHPNAPLGSFVVGDDIPVRARVDGVGRVDIRHRVTALDWDVDASSLVATCKRSDSFTYRPPVMTA